MAKTIMPKKKHYWWRYLLCIFSGIIITLGGIAGGAYYLGTQKSVKDVLKLVGVDSSQYLTETYEDKSIYDLIVNFSKGDIDLSSLSGIREITPYVDKLVDTVNETLEKHLGFTYDKEDLYKVNFDKIGDYLFNTLKDGVYISNLMNITSESDKILQYLAFLKNEDGTINLEAPRSLSDLIEGANTIVSDAILNDVIDVGVEGDVLYNFKDFKITELGAEFNNMTVGDIIIVTEESSPVLKYLENKKFNEIEGAINAAKLKDVIDVGTEGLLFNLRETEISNLSNAVSTMKLNQIITIKDTDYPALQYLGNYNTSEFDQALRDATLENLLDIKEGSILYNIRTSKIDELDTSIQELYLKDVIDVKPEDDKILQCLKDVKIKDLTTKINTLTLNDAIEIDPETSPKILIALQNTNIKDLSSRIQTLTLGEMLADVESSSILKSLSNSTLDTLVSDVDKLTMGDVLVINEDSLPILKALQGTKIVDLETTIKGLTMKTIIDIKPTSSPILISIQDATLETIASTIDELKIGDVMEIDSNSPLILQSLNNKNILIKDLGTTINTLKLSEMVDMSGAPKILIALKDATLSSLATTIDSLKINDIVDTSSSKFLAAIPENTTLNNIGNALNNLKFNDLFHDEIYGSDGNIKSTWKYLLLEEGESEVSAGLNYKIGTDMGKLIINMERNMKSATLQELYDDGFLNLSDANILYKKIIFEGSLVFIGTLTMSSFIEACASLL